MPIIMWDGGGECQRGIASEPARENGINIFIVLFQILNKNGLQSARILTSLLQGFLAAALDR